MSILRQMFIMVFGTVLINTSFASDNKPETQGNCDQQSTSNHSSTESSVKIFMDPNTKEIISKEEYQARGYELPAASATKTIAPTQSFEQRVLADGTVIVHLGNNFQSNLVATKTKSGALSIRHEPMQGHSSKTSASNHCEETE